MRKLNYSKQNTIIKSCLAECSHPTVDELYIKVKEQLPNVSLATVYRNLNSLSERGELQKLTFTDGPARFDPVVKPHYHFVCRKCGKVYDLDLGKVRLEFDKEIEALHGRVDAHELVCYGVCKSCMKLEKKSESKAEAPTDEKGLIIKS